MATPILTTAAPPRQRTARVSGTRGILAAVRCAPGQELGVQARAALAHRAYEDALGRTLSAQLRWVAPRLALWTLDDRPAVASARVAWGSAPDGVERALDGGADLPGVWVVAGMRGDALRLVSSPVVMHTLVRARGAGAEAFATRGLAALLLAGREPRVAWERVAEWVFFDYVLGSEELLEGTEVLEEAALVDLHPDRAHVRSWWPRPVRWGPGAETTPAQVREAVRGEAARLAKLPGATLGLTAGRDSALVAEVLPRGSKAFTIGWTGHPDSDAAAARARALGLDHQVAEVRPQRARFEELVRAAVWQEGIENPRTVAVGPLHWGAREAVWVTGHGGELGRAFYWPSGPPASLDAALESLMRPTAGITHEAAEALRARLGAQLLALADIRRSPDGALDLFYAAGRMHKWLGRVLPYRQIAGFAPAFLAPTVVRALLDLPLEARLSGAAFGPPAQAHEARRTIRERAVRKLRGREDWPLLRPLVAACRRPAAVDVLGDAWWASTLDIARHHDWAQQWTWNVLATEALDVQAARLRRALGSAG